MSEFGEFQPCPFCKQYRWTNRFHKCPPTWWVHHEPSHGPLTEFDDHTTIHAHTALEAAEKWAERFDADDMEYSIVKGDWEMVRVKEGTGEGEWEWFTVEGEAVPQYRAEPGRRES